jgi:hypothetical protein
MSFGRAADGLDVNSQQELRNVQNLRAKKVFKFTEESKFKGQTLSYPYKRVYENSTDYVMFEFFNYNPPFSGSGNAKVDTPDGGSKVLNKAWTEYNESNSNLTSSGLPAILMYMPSQGIDATYKTDWGGKGFTNVGIDALKSVGATIGKGPGAGIQEVINRLTQATGRVPSFAANVIAEAINNLPGRIGGNVDINDVLGGIGGVVINPNAELMFTGFEMRSFGLEFKMTPYDEQEANIIKEIITTFKKAALPSIGKPPSSVLDPIFGGDGFDTKNPNANYIGVPNLVKVTFKRGSEDHPFLVKYKPCALTDIKVDYTPDGTYATYAGTGASDGSPVATVLTLGFKESKLVYSQDITSSGASY